jgi:putative cardiolipin synthase
MLQACASIPEDYPRTESHAISAEKSQNTRIGRAVARDLAARPGQSAFQPLSDGLDALAARLGLAMYAEKTLDVQYYIWRGDTTGVAVAYSLLQAADRGVRVRMLLDDLQVSTYDPALRALDQHPNIEVRMFNPSAARHVKAFELLSRFGRLNRRMHNKSFIVDNQMAIVGGRNIGDEYFSASPEVDFSDFDVLAVGPIVPEVSATFDMYWNSELAVPISVLYGEQDQVQTLEVTRQRLQAGWEKARDSEYAEALRNSDFVHDMNNQEARFYWGTAHAVADSPSKILNSPEDKATHLGPQLVPLLKQVETEFFIISPYFVPGDDLVEYFKDLVDKGVKVEIVTNSLAANDVGIVHAGYSKYRRALLDAGVQLYEYKSNSVKSKKNKNSNSVGSSTSSLHSKVFVIDRKYLFVGSMNLDPRSFNLNSELGIVVESKQFANEFVDAVEARLLDKTYHLKLVFDDEDQGADSDKSIQWQTIENGSLVSYDDEPNVGFLRKLGIWFMSLFVSEELL